LRNVPVNQKTTGENRWQNVFKAAGGQGSATDEEAHKRKEQHVRRPNAGENAVSHRAVVDETELNRGEHEQDGNDQSAFAVVVDNGEAPNEEAGLNKHPRNDVGVKLRGHQPEEVMEQPFADRVAVEEQRAGMMESEATIVAIQLVPEFSVSNLERVCGEIVELRVRLTKKKIIMNPHQKHREAKPDEDKRVARERKPHGLREGIHSESLFRSFRRKGRLASDCRLQSSIRDKAPRSSDIYSADTIPP
jgi:hypothetical protein